MDDARQKYRQHRRNAARRGIAFELTFDEWWQIWEPHYARRGTSAEQLGMCRDKDQGPYAVGNVRLDTPKGNHAERGMLQRMETHAGLEPRLMWKGKVTSLPAQPSWMNRHNVFEPYFEPEED